MFVDCNTYKFFRKDRPTRGGGDCILIKNSATIVVSQVVVPSGFDDLDIVAIDLTDCNNTLPIRLIAVYRPPSMTSSDNARLFSVLDLLAEDCVRLCVFGDLNLPHINWDLFVYIENFLYCSAVRPIGLKCFTMPNLVKIGRTTTEIWRLFDFSRWRPPPSWILKI